MKLKLYDIIKEDEFYRVKLKDEFRELLKQAMKNPREYYARKLRIPKYLFNSYFRKVCRSNPPFRKMYELCKNIGINKGKLFENIEYFTLEGCRKKRTYLPKTIFITPEFVEGYSLYIAEGDTGISGKHKSKKMRLSSSDLPIIQFFMRWLIKYLKQRKEDFGIYIYVPSDFIYEKFVDKISKNLGINKSQIILYKDKYVTKPKFRISIGRATIMRVFYFIEPLIKHYSSKNKSLAAAYLRGLMAGEGTVYSGKLNKALNCFTKYVRLEMKNEKEVKFAGKLLKLLKIDYKLKERKDRKDHWEIYIYGNRKNFSRFGELVGFGCNENRQRKLGLVLRS